MEPNRKAGGRLDRDELSSQFSESLTQDAIVESQPENQAALAHLQKARQRLYAAAIAYCEGHISAGQLRAVRELLRAHEQRLAELGEVILPPFIDEFTSPAGPERDGPEAVDTARLTPAPQEPLADSPLLRRLSETKTQISETHSPEQGMQEKLDVLERKLARLDDDIREGRVNPSQYRAIHRHYEEQRTVALRLHERNPAGEQWRVVLQDGKTNFLMQIHEALCIGVAFYDYRDQNCLYLEGRIPDQAREGITFLGAFGGPVAGDQSDRMFATQADDGTTLLLIPGRYSAVLAAYSKEPPEWQARALREVHRNFEYANRAVFEKGKTRRLVFPDMRNFIRS